MNELVDIMLCFFVGFAVILFWIIENRHLKRCDRFLNEKRLLENQVSKEMSEKVLKGFYEKSADIEKQDSGWLEVTIHEQDFVPVRLASESVDLKDIKELKDFSEQLVENKDLYLEKKLNPADVELFFDSIEDLNNMIKDLAEKEAKKNE